MLQASLTRSFCPVVAAKSLFTNPRASPIPRQLLPHTARVKCKMHKALDISGGRGGLQQRLCLSMQSCLAPSSPQNGRKAVETSTPGGRRRKRRAMLKTCLLQREPGSFPSSPEPGMVMHTLAQLGIFHLFCTCALKIYEHFAMKFELLSVLIVRFAAAQLLLQHPAPLCQDEKIRLMLQSDEFCPNRESLVPSEANHTSMHFPTRNLVPCFILYIHMCIFLHMYVYKHILCMRP